MIVAIDGPAGSGKSTTARGVAEKLGYAYLDTGAMYRAITYKALEKKIPVDDQVAIAKMVEETNIEMSMKNAEIQQENKEYRISNIECRTYIDGEDVTKAIRRPEVDRNVSLISSYIQVREKMVELQRRIVDEMLNAAESARFGRTRKGVVCEGRDMGTVVFPGADIKIYLDASLSTRAKRRKKESNERGSHLSLQQVESDLQRRDHLDSEREVSPLKKATDAIHVDTTNLSIEDEIEKIVGIVRKRESMSLGSQGVENQNSQITQKTQQTQRLKNSRRSGHWTLSVWFLNATLHWLLGARVNGRENIPSTGSLLIASNHISFLDPPLIGWAVNKREVYYLAQEELFQLKKAFAWLIRKFNAIPLKRRGFDRKAFRKAAGLVKRGEAVVIFPEGTRSKIGRFLPPKPGLGFLAFQTRVPVIPARIVGSDHPIRSLFLRQERMSVKFGTPLDYDQYSHGTQKLTSTKARLQAISEEIMKAIAQL
jgi:cytidylate kinase